MLGSTQGEKGQGAAAVSKSGLVAAAAESAGTAARTSDRVIEGVGVGACNDRLPYSYERPRGAHLRRTALSGVLLE